MVKDRALKCNAMLFIVAAWSFPAFAALPWLHTEGNLIKDPDGNIVVLRGVDLIDLGFLDAWQGGAFEMIDRLTDTSDDQSNSPGWYPRVLRINITPADASPTWPNRFDPGNNNFYNNLLRPVVDYCRTKDLYVIIDWHYVANTYDHAATTSAFWEYMAPRFAGDSHVLFELFNEPINDLDGDWIFNSHDNDDWNSVRADMQTWYDIVRTYAPNNIVLVAGAFYSQLIGPAATYPLTGNNIVIVSHLYPNHWLDSYWLPSYQGQINTALTVYPVFMSEWGFSMDSDAALRGTITNYGLPISNWREDRKIGNSAWVASYDWGPPMFYTDWTLRVGEGQMGGFVKDTLYLKRNSDQPGGGGDVTPPSPPTNLAASVQGAAIVLSWTANSESDLYGYNVYRSQTSGAGYTKLNAAFVTGTLYIDNTALGGVTYYYVVTAVDDSANESGHSNETSAATVDTGMGTILREWWTGISGTSISSLTSNVNYPNNPSGSDRLTQLEAPLNWNDNYGTRIRGYLHPAVTGSYTFWIAGDDNSQLWLSTDGTPANAAMIGQVSGWTDSRQWTKYAAQQSSPRTLTAGQKYYIEVLHKEGTGGDNIAVAWSGPGISQQVIAGGCLSRWLTGLYGDFDGNSSVRLDDFAELASAWLLDSCSLTAAKDLNGDCTVDLYEFYRFAENWLTD